MVKILLFIFYSGSLIACCGSTAVAIKSSPPAINAAQAHRYSASFSSIGTYHAPRRIDLYRINAHLEQYKKSHPGVVIAIRKTVSDNPELINAEIMRRHVRYQSRNVEHLIGAMAKLVADPEAEVPGVVNT